MARVWALTGCRRDEIANLRRSEVDLGRGLLVFGDRRTGKAVRPLGTAAGALLRFGPAPGRICGGWRPPSAAHAFAPQGQGGFAAFPRPAGREPAPFPARAPGALGLSASSAGP
jgi:hypothetical protein